MSELPRTREYEKGSRSRHLKASWALEQEADAMHDELLDRIADLELTLSITSNLYEYRGKYIAELRADRARKAEAIHDLVDRAEQAEAALAGRDKESIDLLDAIFQTIDPEDGEEIVAEAFPKGGPAWVLAWYQEHPNEEELAARAEEGSKP